MEKTGYRIRYKGVYRLYRNGVVVRESPYSLLDAFGNVPAITVEELEVMTTTDIEARAALMIEHIAGRCSEFNVINDIIYPSAECVDEEDFMIGQIIDYAGVIDSWDAEKWMNCDGRVLNVANYPELYAAIGREWTTNSNLVESQFQIPHLGGRVSIGYDATTRLTPRTNPGVGIDNYRQVGNTGGKISISLTKNEMPLHNHPSGSDIYAGNRAEDDSGGLQTYYTGTRSGYSVTKNNWTDFVGGNAAHENRQPYAVVFKLIRYK